MKNWTSFLDDAANSMRMDSRSYSSSIWNIECMTLSLTHYYFHVEKTGGIAS